MMLRGPRGGGPRTLDVEAPGLELEQARQEIRVVDFAAVRGVVVAARAGVDADPLALLRREAAEHAADQVHEPAEQLPARVELHGQAPLGEVELHL